VSDDRLLVPVADTPTVRQTVESAVKTALGDSEGYVRFVYVHSPDSSREEEDPTVDPPVKETTEFLNRVVVWARDDAGDREDDLTVETARLGFDDYLFSPEDVAEVLIEDGTAHDVGRVVLDPEYDPGVGAPFLRPLEYELAKFPGLDVEEAPVQARARRTPLLAGSTPIQAGALFFVSFAFYQVLAGTLELFDVVTGAVSATIVAVGLARVTFHTDPTFASLGRTLRLVVYLPYLLYEILKANVQVAAVILHPRLPIDPRLTRVRAAVWGGLPVTTLANSITLTPGTLSVRVDGRTLTVHTLVPAARESLFDGGLERGVRFVFYGRDAMQIASLRERNDTRVLQPPDEAETTDGDDSEGDVAKPNETGGDGANSNGGNSQ